MMSFDDSFGQPQAQPSSYFFFRGKKRLEKLGSNCLWDSRARICHGEPYPRSSLPVPLCCWRDSQANLSTSCDCVDTVAQEIRNELADLIGHRINLGITSDLSADIDRFISCSGSKNGDDLVQYEADSYWFGSFRFAVEAESLLRQVRNTGQFLFRGG